jgi:MarR-like DNA-binding transcriptional regulator SgrR of sgrS sRNA
LISPFCRPFKFKEYKTGEYVTLERFDNYFGGKPHLDSVTYFSCFSQYPLHSQKCASESGIPVPGPPQKLGLAEDEYVTLERFDNYFGGKPHLDSVTYRIVKDSNAANSNRSVVFRAFLNIRFILKNVLRNRGYLYQGRLKILWSTASRYRRARLMIRRWTSSFLSQPQLLRRPR